jgi:acetyl esterase/lipase
MGPTWMYTSDIELFHDEDIEYANRLRAAGADLTVEVVGGAPHGLAAWASDHPMAPAPRNRPWLARGAPRALSVLPDHLSDDSTLR